MDFTKIITGWYKKNKRDLPWRRTKDPYKIWLSEIMLQQTRVDQGLPYYLKFIENYPKVNDLANAEEAAVLKLWQGLGYYSRARNLHHTAKVIAFDNKGFFPDTYSELIKLKGIGDYTASAIASICFNRPTAVVDGNVYRVLARYFGIDIPVNLSKGIKYFKDLAIELIDHNDPGTYNQAIMEFGARQCKPQNPDCSICPLNKSCVALQKNEVKKLPKKLKKGKIKKRYFNYLILSNGINTIIEQRTKKDIWQNLYEFPLLETPKPISIEEIQSDQKFKDYIKTNDYDIRLHNDKDIVHKLSHQHIYTRFWVLDIENLPKKGVEISRIKRYAMPVLIANFVEEYSF
ncbi:A/G-specific adenine glycosylase [Leptobacterium sp. I13]|uniref:A/G-specific adenine glycosylase n=1 Tax=Leptobacterium meishanense TaxID=3128904 RepID=UPI0030EDBDC9